MRHEVLLSIGRIVEVIQEPDRAVFVRVELSMHRTRAGEPLEATCRLVVPYHGADFGDWHIPALDTDVLCFFPGPGGGAPWGDLDEGYAFGYVSSIPEPPTDGFFDALGPLNRVYVGQGGVKHDVHIREERNTRIEANEFSEVAGARIEVILGNHEETVDGDRQILVKGDRSATFQGNDDNTNQKAFTRFVTGAAQYLFESAAVWTGNVILQFLSPVIEMGLATVAFQRLVDERMIAVFNAHTHDSGNPPDQQLSVANHTTSNVKAN